MHLALRRFLRGRRLSARPEDARHAADAGESCEGAADDSEGEGAENRSGDGRARRAGGVVEGAFRAPDAAQRVALRGAVQSRGPWRESKMWVPALRSGMKNASARPGQAYSALLRSCRLASNRNQVRRSVSSMNNSSNWAVPVSS